MLTKCDPESSHPEEQSSKKSPARLMALLQHENNNNFQPVSRIKREIESPPPTASPSFEYACSDGDKDVDRYIVLRDDIPASRLVCHQNTDLINRVITGFYYVN